MRFDVHTIRRHLVRELIQASQVREVWHDGSDMIILDLKDDKSISIHMVERFMSVDEITYIFNHNTEAGHHTMLILWAAMFMPSHGQIYQPDDWMFALLQLYGGKIYAYDAWRDEPHIFTVSFEKQDNGRTYTAHHGSFVNIGQIGTTMVELTQQQPCGFWRVARFDGHEETTWDDDLFDIPENATVRYYLNLLGLPADATLAQLKLAYRDLARQHHPDRNPDEDTTARMQTINDAYLRIQRYLDDLSGGLDA
jgi:hypothetical protein